MYVYTYVCMYVCIMYVCMYVCYMYMYIPLSHRVISRRRGIWYANICCNRRKRLTDITPRLVRIAPLAVSRHTYIITLLRSWHWRLREIPLRSPGGLKVAMHFCHGQFAETKRKKTVVRIRLIDDKFYWNMYNDAMTCEEFARRLRYRFFTARCSLSLSSVALNGSCPGDGRLEKEKIISSHFTASG